MLVMKPENENEESRGTEGACVFRTILNTDSDPS